MNKIHKSIQHIQKDLVLMTGLLKGSLWNQILWIFTQKILWS